MDIWLLRHATAEDRSATGRDADRELTPDGLRRAQRVARGLAALEPGIEMVLTSPFRRARQTAEAAARALALERRLSLSGALEPQTDPDDILEEIAAHGSGCVLLVGHEPHLGELLGRLVGSGVALPLRKAAVAWVEREGRAGTLRALLPAPILERIR